MEVTAREEDIVVMLVVFAVLVVVAYTLVLVLPRVIVGSVVMLKEAVGEITELVVVVVELVPSVSVVLVEPSLLEVGPVGGTLEDETPEQTELKSA